MLHFDHAYNMMGTKDYRRAIRSYDRCLAIRPNSGGIWRGLGVALRHVDQYADSIDALTQSIVHQPDHAPTYVDLGLTLEAVGDREGALHAYEQALERNADLAEAHERVNALKVQDETRTDEEGE